MTEKNVLIHLANKVQNQIAVESNIHNCNYDQWYKIVLGDYYYNFICLICLQSFILNATNNFSIDDHAKIHLKKFNMKAFL